MPKTESSLPVSYAYRPVDSKLNRMHVRRSRALKLFIALCFAFIFLIFLALHFYSPGGWYSHFIPGYGFMNWMASTDSSLKQPSSSSKSVPSHQGQFKDTSIKYKQDQDKSSEIDMFSIFQSLLNGLREQPIITTMIKGFSSEAIKPLSATLGSFLDEALPTNKLQPIIDSTQELMNGQITIMQFFIQNIRALFRFVSYLFLTIFPELGRDLFEFLTRSINNIIGLMKRKNSSVVPIMAESISSALSPILGFTRTHSVQATNILEKNLNQLFPDMSNLDFTRVHTFSEFSFLFLPSFVVCKKALIDIFTQLGTMKAQDALAQTVVSSLSGYFSQSKKEAQKISDNSPNLPPINPAILSDLKDDKDFFDN